MPSKSMRKTLKLIKILVEVPKPLSIKWAGIVSSNILVVAYRSTPTEKPKMTLPKHRP